MAAIRESFEEHSKVAMSGGETRRAEAA